MDFRSDNIAPVHPHIWEKLKEADEGNACSYGHDKFTEQLTKKIADIFQHDVSVFCATTGGASNCLALSSLCPPLQTIYCYNNAHINVHESGGIESLGYKLSQIQGREYKIDVTELQKSINFHNQYAPHTVKPGAISVTQPTEIGTIYDIEHIKNLKKIGLPIHMDGARFANALVALNCHPSDLSWKAGVDVLSLGGTKNGCMFGEAIIFFNQKYAKDFEYRVKKMGQLTSKMRYLSAQMIAYFDVWLDNARTANTQAKKLSEILSTRYTPAYPIETNQIFFTIPKKEADILQNKGAAFYEWEKNIYRFVTHFNTTDSELLAFKRLLSALD